MIDGVMFTNSLGTVVGQIVEVTVRIHCLMSTIIGSHFRAARPHSKKRLKAKPAPRPQPRFVQPLSRVQLSIGVRDGIVRHLNSVLRRRERTRRKIARSELRRESSTHG